MSKYITIEFKCDTKEETSELCRSLQAKYGTAFSKKKGIRISAMLFDKIPSLHEDEEK